MEGSFSEELQKGLDLLDTQRDAEAELVTLDEQIHLLQRLAPLNMDLELLAGSGRVEVYVSETKKRAKPLLFLARSAQRLRWLPPPASLPWPAFLPKVEVQMALGELGGKPVQIPNMTGTPTRRSKALCPSARRLRASCTLLQKMPPDGRETTAATSSPSMNTSQRKTRFTRRPRNLR